MERIALKKFEDKINSEIQDLENLETHTQELYDAVGIDTLTMKELKTLIRSSNPKYELKKLKIAQKHSNEPLEVLGFPVDMDKLMELIVIPDLGKIMSKLNKVGEISDYQLLDYLSLKDNKISLVPDFKEIVNEKHTIYTQTENQTELAQDLIKLRDEINGFLDKTGFVNKLSNLFPGLKTNSNKGHSRVDIDLQYITSR